MARDALTERQWERRQQRLPPRNPRRGIPAKEHRLLLNGILWVLRPGAPASGPWQTLATRFYRWVTAGLWAQILAAR